MRLSDFSSFSDDFEEEFLNAKLRRVRDAVEMEELYWKFLHEHQGNHQDKEVLYASDIEGSVWPCRDDNEFGSQWNLRNMARLEKGVLRFVDGAVPGVTDPMICMSSEIRLLTFLRYCHAVLYFLLALRRQLALFDQLQSCWML
jgi:hypothetical protein